SVCAWQFASRPREVSGDALQRRDPLPSDFIGRRNCARGGSAVLTSQDTQAGKAYARNWGGWAREIGKYSCKDARPMCEPDDAGSVSRRRQALETRPFK